MMFSSSSSVIFPPGPPSIFDDSISLPPRLEQPVEQQEEEEESIWIDDTMISFLTKLYNLADLKNTWENERPRIARRVVASYDATIRPHPSSFEMYLFYAALPHLGVFIFFTLSRIQWETKYGSKLTLYHVVHNEEWTTVFLSLFYLFYTQIRLETTNKYATKLSLVGRVTELNNSFNLCRSLHFPSNINPAILNYKARNIVTPFNTDLFKDVLLKGLLVPLCFQSDLNQDLIQSFNQVLLNLSSTFQIEPTFQSLIRGQKPPFYWSFLIRQASLHFFLNYSSSHFSLPKHLRLQMLEEFKSLDIILQIMN